MKKILILIICLICITNVVYADDAEPMTVRIVPDGAYSTVAIGSEEDVAKLGIFRDPFTLTIYDSCFIWLDDIKFYVDIQSHTITDLRYGLNVKQIQASIEDNTMQTIIKTEQTTVKPAKTIKFTVDSTLKVTLIILFMVSVGLICLYIVGSKHKNVNDAKKC